MKKNFPKDIHFMKQALALAKRGRGFVHPNPLVGAVLVKNNQIIGRGFHACLGKAHAEVNAFRSARRRAEGAALYVTLEPCAHFGKTPPCIDGIIQNKIREVVVGAMDPNPLVSGKGIKILKKAGIKVRCGILKSECEALNADYDYWTKKKIPYAVVKIAQSLDGKIATKTGESRWITGEAARSFSHVLRAGSDAILVGVNTVLKDDPLLSTRSRKSRSPVKVILDSRLRTPLTAKIFSKDSPGKVLLAVTKKAQAHQWKKFEGKAEIILVREKNGKTALRELFYTLAKMGIVRVLIEGGGEVIADAFAEDLVREAYFFIAPKIIGGREAVPSVGGKGIARLQDAVRLKNSEIRKIGGDFLIHAKVG